MDTAKLFQNGRSQAVRLPKEFRFSGKEVAIRREGDAVVLEPLRAKTWPKGLFTSIRIRDARFRRPAQGAVPKISG